MRILGINAVFHDLAAALVVDGEIVAAAEAVAPDVPTAVEIALSEKIR